MLHFIHVARSQSFQTRNGLAPCKRSSGIQGQRSNFSKEITQIHINMHTHVHILNLCITKVLYRNATSFSLGQKEQSDALQLHFLIIWLSFKNWEMYKNQDCYCFIEKLQLWCYWTCIPHRSGCLELIRGCPWQNWAF